MAHGEALWPNTCCGTYLTAPADWLSAIAFDLPSMADREVSSRYILSNEMLVLTNQLSHARKVLGLDLVLPDMLHRYGPADRLRGSAE